MSVQFGTCPECAQVGLRLTKDGMLREHLVGGKNPEWCRGGGQSPLVETEDK